MQLTPKQVKDKKVSKEGSKKEKLNEGIQINKI